MRDASGRFAPARKPVGRPRKIRTISEPRTNVRSTGKPFNPIGSFGYDDDAEELTTEPYTSDRVERIKAQKHQIAVMQRINIVLVVIAFLLLAFIYALLLTALYDWRQP